MTSKYVDDETLECCSCLSDIDLEPQCLVSPIDNYEKMPLVSLEEATEPLLHLLPNVHQMVPMAKQKCKTPSNGLSCDESASIYLYSMEWEPREKCVSFVLNATIRDKNYQTLEPWFLYLKLILTALGRLPSLRCFIYRGIKMDLSTQYSEGKGFVWSAFSSCTASIRNIERFLGRTSPRTVFVIECKNGKDIREHSYHRSESEILLLPARYFTVIGRLNTENGVYYIHLREIERTVPPIQLTAIAGAAGVAMILPSLFFGPGLLFVHAAGIVKTAWNSYYSKYRNSALENEIKKCAFRSEVNLTGHNLNDDDMKIVVTQAIIDRECKILRLNNNEVTLKGISILFDALRDSSTLRELYLGYNQVSDDCVLLLALQLSFGKSILKVLDLQCNDITDDGTRYLAGMLKTNIVLKELWLSNNAIGDEGAQILANALAYSNASLTDLSLDSNKSISDRSIDSIIDMLRHNQALQKLDMTHCELSEAGKVRLRHAARSKKHFQLILEEKMEMEKSNEQLLRQFLTSDPLDVVKTKDNDRWIYPVLLLHLSLDSRLHSILNEIADHHFMFIDDIDSCITRTCTNKNITTLIIEVEPLAKDRLNRLISDVSALDHVESIYLLGKPPEKDEAGSEFFTQCHKVCMFCENEERLALRWALNTSEDCRTLGDRYIKSGETDLAREQYEHGMALYERLANFIKKKKTESSIC